MLRDNNRPFLAIMAVACVLLSLIIWDNITPEPRPVMIREEQGPTQTLGQKLPGMKLPLHEGKYWKAIDE